MLRGVILGALAATASVGLPAHAHAAGHEARAARVCEPPEYPGSGYFTSLSVKGVRCATGRKVALAYHRCRLEQGKAGKCTRRVLRFRCTENRNRIPTELNARVKCRRGTDRVTHTYQQNL